MSQVDYDGVVDTQVGVVTFEGEVGTVVAVTLDTATVVLDFPSIISGVGSQGPVIPETPVYIGPTAPVSPPSKYLWIKTGLGVGGVDFQFLFEDGS